MSKDNRFASENWKDDFVLSKKTSKQETKKPKGKK
jgi:hypothetical protein